MNASLRLALIFGLFLSACRTVEVSELSKSRTHSFTYTFDGERILLKGKLSIEGKLYPAEIYYDKERSAVSREGQCLEFAPDKVLFGFLPPFALERAGVEVITSGDYATTYTIEQDTGNGIETSLVKFSGEVATGGKAEFTDKCLSGEDLINVE